MEKFTVIVDPSLESIIPRYMELQFEGLSELERALILGDNEAVRLLGHKLKGTGASYGLEALSELGAALELSGRDNDMNAATALSAQLRSFLENVEITYGE